MKKVSLVAIAILSILSSYSQTFDGVPISGKLIDCVNKFKAKGYILTTNNETGVIMKGKIAAQEIELYLYKTPKTLLVTKAVIFLPKKTTWTQLKNNYTDYLQLLVGKYGDYDKSASTFLDPYTEGDGYEMSAVSLEKCLYIAFWENRNNTNIMIEISKYSQVKIVYENVANMALKDKEKEELERNVF